MPLNRHRSETILKVARTAFLQVQKGLSRVLFAKQEQNECVVNISLVRQEVRAQTESWSWLRDCSMSAIACR